MTLLNEIKHFALDLDGTLYLGGKLFDCTLDFLHTLKRNKLGRTFFTNNSSKSARQYVHHLQSMGIDATIDEIQVSTHSTFAYLRQEHSQVKRVFVLGTPELQIEFASNGFTLCGEDPADEPQAVIVGFDTTLTYARAARAAYWISKGKLFVATHPDRICPTNEPIVLPDCAAICKMLTVATGREPNAVLGKPHPLMIQDVIRRQELKASELAVVGDRIYTDMAMARSVGAMGILVLSGETTPEQSKSASPVPDLIVKDVGELAQLLAKNGRGARC